MAISVGSTILASDINSNVLMPKTGGTFTGSSSVYSPFTIQAPSGKYSSTQLKLQGSANNKIDGYISYENTTGSIGGSKKLTVGLESSYTIGNGWNDYSETRKTSTTIPGTCVSIDIKGILNSTTERMMPECYIISDTWGQCIGEANDTPVAVMGRVLATPYSDPTNWPIGAAVCSAPNGTIDLMTREEVIKYPDRIIGTISEKPKYDKWYPDEDDKDIYVEVKGRIWIYIL